MTIKIKAPMAYALPYSQCSTPNREFESDIPVRIVAESDWRKLMKLVKVVDEHDHAGGDHLTHRCDICEALAALRKEKKK